MNMDKETKEQVKKYFSSKKFIIAAAIFLLAVGTGVGTAVSVKNELNEQLSSIEETLNFTKAKETEKAANDLTGITVENTQPSDEENITVIKTEGYILPAGEEIIKDFSNSVAVKSKTMNDWRVHNGVDFKAQEGDAVRAMQSGAVLAIYNNSLWGTVVEIDHGAGIVVKYCGLAEDCFVTASDVVEQGQVIGKIGLIPVEAADGAHLHIEVLKDGTAIDPFELFVEQQ